MRVPLLLLVLGLLAGCSRSYYRSSADRETYPIIIERQVRPDYDIGRIHVEPPPGSRLADPFNPDRPPKPPDDPAAAIFMACPDGMKGARGWGRDGFAGSIEPPEWQEALGLDAHGSLKLTQDKAVEIALLDSREYQSALEGVYLSALALTLNRFEFDLHWLGRNSTEFTHFGSGGFPKETNTLSSLSELGLTRNLAAGGQLIVDFANSIVFEYTGKTSHVNSNLAVTLTQPLLRNFGRAVRLETLTQAERDVLYEVRTFAHFRKQFWAGIAVQNGGYLNLLLAVQTARNFQANLQRQEETYQLYNELFRGGRKSAVELDQFYTAVQTARQGIIDSESALQSAEDAFKLQLGIPPRIPVELDDSLLNRFILTDPALEKLHTDLEAFQRDRLKELDAAPTVADLGKDFATLRRLADRLPAALKSAEADLKAWGKTFERSLRPGEDPEPRQRARAVYDTLAILLPQYTADLKQDTDTLEKHRRGVTEATRKQSWEDINQDVKKLLAVLDGALAAQTQARIYSIELPEVDATEAEALATAKENRLDLQNRLGAVTDAWRKVTVAANALRADLSVVASANLGTDPNHRRPFNFAAEASQYTVGLQFDSPLNRQAERNVYRASLITYQQAKRAYEALSDQIEFQIRQDLRQLQRLKAGFEIARQQLLSAARQYENARLTLLGPQQPNAGNDATTLNLLQALSGLLSARNALAQSFINFEQQRIQLLLDLEALQLDQRGIPTNASSRPPGPGAAGGEPGPTPRPVESPPARAAGP